MAKIFINNSSYMEFIDEIATQMTEIAYTDTNCIAYKEIKDGLSDETCIVFTDEAQEYYNQKYDEVEWMVNQTLNIHSIDNEIWKAEKNS